MKKSYFQERPSFRFLRLENPRFEEQLNHLIDAPPGSFDEIPGGKIDSQVLDLMFVIGESIFLCSAIR